MGPSPHPLVAGFCATCKPADRRPPWQWCEEHLTVDESSPSSGRLRAAYSPWVRTVTEVFADNDVSDIAVQCAAQRAETQTVIDILKFDGVFSPAPRPDGLANKSAPAAWRRSGEKSPSR